MALSLPTSVVSSAEKMTGTVSWAAEPHCLLVQMTPAQIVIVRYGATPPGGQPQPIPRQRFDGSITDNPIVIPLD